MKGSTVDRLEDCGRRVEIKANKAMQKNTVMKVARQEAGGRKQIKGCQVASNSDVVLVGIITA